MSLYVFYLFAPFIIKSSKELSGLPASHQFLSSSLKLTPVRHLSLHATESGLAKGASAFHIAESSGYFSPSLLDETQLAPLQDACLPQLRSSPLLGAPSTSPVAPSQESPVSPYVGVSQAKYSRLHLHITPLEASSSPLAYHPYPDDFQVCSSSLLFRLHYTLICPISLD